MSYVTVSYPQLVLSLGLMALAIAISSRNHLGLEKDLLVGTLRAAVQLFAVGFILTVVFQNERPATVLGVIAVMVVVGGWTAARRIAHGPGSLERWCWSRSSPSSSVPRAGTRRGSSFPSRG
jgi:ABC-type iron transport system FetAB permease component